MHITSSIVTLKPGIYVLRHPKGGLPPLSVARAPGDGSASGRMETIFTPNTHGAVLRDGSDCIVVHVMDAPVQLVVTAFLADADAVVPAMRVDQIGLDAPAAAIPATTDAKAQAKAITVSDKGVSVIAHIERTGDVVASEGDCAGNPATNLRLEGFQVEWPDRPDGVDIVYSIAVEGLGAMPVVHSGKFCGTRGQARRITEVSFSLQGPRAHLYQLEGAAYFTGGFQVALSSGIAASGPSGLEHLTALRLRAVAASAAAVPANPWTESDRTTVFKAPKVAAKKVVAAKPAAKKQSARPAPKTRAKQA